MEQQAIFRRQLGGFHKNDVLGYIDTLTQSYLESKEALTAQTNELASANEQLTQALQNCEREKSHLAQEHAQQDETIRMLNAQLETLRQSIAQKDAELLAHGQTLAQVQKKLEESTQKNQEYDKAVKQIGATFVQARESARQIVDSAQDVAQRVMQNAQQKAAHYQQVSQQTIDQVNAQVGAVKEEILTLKEDIASTISSITQKLDDLWASLDATQVRFGKAMPKGPAPKGAEAKADMQFTRAFDRLTDEQIQSTAQEMLKTAEQAEKPSFAPTAPKPAVYAHSGYSRPAQVRVRPAQSTKTASAKGAKSGLGTQFRNWVGGWLK